MSFADVMTQVARFTTETTARSYADRAAGRWIVLGDEGQYWVTTYRYARWLEKNGYAIID